MPELPEMETYANALRPRVVGRRITQTIITREKSINVPVTVWTECLVGSAITQVERRGKHLLFHLPGEQLLLLHLMLGGWMFWGREDDKPERTIQVQLSFGEEHLYFIGLRLGYLHLWKMEEAERKLAALGPNPLELTEEMFRKRLLTRRSTLKAAFLDQGFLAGIGNCYTDELCFEAGIRPDRRTHELPDEEQTRLFQAMLELLNRGIRSGGYMEHPFYVGDAHTGGFNELCQVYDRGGEACHRCGNSIVQSELAGRKLFYCPGCQR
ncbi:DNA-formamidopyrimidine glycosylase family protein [Gorillibacterium sp. CAU 1737]|uniref:Fpg/Nei family DNA glycosylase n=1 Tax=Gorillibacterium sp. CAU 1737 TaxID=3140362 RepID=UPI0032608AE6